MKKMDLGKNSLTLQSFVKIYFYLKANFSEKKREIKKSPIHWVAPHLVAVTRVELI